MADTKISELTAATSTDGSEVLPIVQSSTTKKLATSAIKDYILGSANTFTASQTVSGASFSLSGNISAAAWTTNGIRYKNVAATLTDTSSSGTVAAAYTNAYGGNTIAASSATTFTNYITTNIAEPTSGTNVTFTNRWALGLTGGLRATGQSLTGSQNQSLVDLAATWNTTGTPTALKLNVTDTASNTNSLLMDLQVGGTSKFSVRKDGNTVGPNSGAVGISGYASYVCTSTSDAGFYAASATGGLFLGAGYDAVFRRDAADTLAQRRSTNAQTFRIYNTFTDASNYERGKIAWSSNVLQIGTEKAGTGTARALALQTDGTTALTLTTAQKAEFAATIKTAAPSGGTAAEWKLGTVASVTPTSPNRTIEVEIGGTTYYISAKTTND